MCILIDYFGFFVVMEFSDNRCLGYFRTMVGDKARDIRDGRVRVKRVVVACVVVLYYVKNIIRCPSSRGLFCKVGRLSCLPCRACLPRVLWRTILVRCETVTNDSSR